MLTFLGMVLRVLIGFVFACLAAGFVQVLFAVTPRELMVAQDDRLSDALTWALLTATQIAVFSAAFALIAIVISEWQGIRSFAYHAIVAMAIAVAGFGLIHLNESPAEASIVNSYAMAAYLTSGFVGGFVYWLLAGRRALRSNSGPVRMESDRRASRNKESRNKEAGDKRQASQSAENPGQKGTEAAAPKAVGTVPLTKRTSPDPDPNKPASAGPSVPPIAPKPRDKSST